ncbi:MAG TPA: bifunctional diaminohydroxyphosphoribosylaminopyrimidine deaminase/5-amino-6-(5-phosphoribosylamino)uracil reductase RibD, partial [Candidatus Binatia bacterium]
MGGDLDERYMRMALRLARKGAGRTSPNPMVGAVLVRRGRVVGKGYHRRAGEDHGEIVALKDAGSRARGATLYINLEPCNHVGRTPPCTVSLIQSGLKEVVVGMVDPNPLVAGRG